MEKEDKKVLRLQDLSKYKSEIYGVSIIWIMLFHAANLKLNYTFGGRSFLEPLDTFISYGNMGVEIFLFCSGIYLYFSYVKTPDAYLFIKKRVARLFWPVLVISGVYWIYNWLISEFNPAVFISKLSLFDFWLSGDTQIWFISCILMCYLMYPYVYGFMFGRQDKKSLIRLAVLLIAACLMVLCIRSAYPGIYKHIEIAITRFPVFFIGCYFGKLVYEKKTMPLWTYALFFALALASLAVLELGLVTSCWKRWTMLVGGISLTFVTVFVINLLHCEFINRILRFFGNMSLSIYVSHTIGIRLYRFTPWHDHKRLLHYLVVLIISVLAAYLGEFIINHVIYRRPLKKESVYIK